MSWHVPGDTLTRYALRPEVIDDVTASSIEQHLMSCGDCRATVAEAADTTAIEASWAAVADVIDQPRPWVAERVLARLGIPADMARVVGATPGLRLAWLVAVVGIAVGAVLVARDTGSDAPFLVIAPLVPLGAVALAFLPVAEPAGEAGVPTALHGAGLVLRRAVAVLVPTMVLLAIAGLAQPDLAGFGVAWVLPGLALAMGSVALSTFVRVPVAVGSVAVAWFAVLYVSRARSVRASVDDLAVFRPAGQAFFLAVIAIAAVILVARRDRFATAEVSW